MSRKGFGGEKNPLKVSFRVVMGLPALGRQSVQ
jgi:hypothetical protein